MKSIARLFFLSLLLLSFAQVIAQPEIEELKKQNQLLTLQVQQMKESKDYLAKMNADIFEKRFNAIQDELRAKQNNQCITIFITLLTAIGLGSFALFKTSKNKIAEIVAQLTGNRVDVIIDSIADYEKLRNFKNNKKILLISRNEDEAKELRKQIVKSDGYKNVTGVRLDNVDFNVPQQADLILLNDYEGIVQDDIAKQILDINPKSGLLWFTSERKQPLDRLTFANSYATLLDNLKKTLDMQDKLSN